MDVKDLTPHAILQKIKHSFDAVFAGEATGEEFIYAFLALASVALIVLFFFIMVTSY